MFPRGLDKASQTRLRAPPLTSSASEGLEVVEVAKRASLCVHCVWIGEAGRANDVLRDLAPSPELAVSGAPEARESVGHAGNVIASVSNDGRTR
jgi:hypothetical protein